MYFLPEIVSISNNLTRINYSVSEVIAMAKEESKKQIRLKLEESLRIREIKNEKIVHFWLYMKTFFRNGTFYQYSPEKLSNLMGVSPNTIRKYVSILSDANWIRKHHGNITCVDRKDVKQVDKYYYRRRNYKRGLSFNDFRELLILNYIKQDNKRQEYAIKTKNILKGKEAKITASSYRKARSISKKYGMKWKEYRNKVVFSYRSLSNKLNLSHSTIQGYITSLASKGMITIKRCYDYIFSGSYYDYICYSKYNDNYAYYKVGRIYADLGWEVLD